MLTGACADRHRDRRRIHSTPRGGPWTSRPRAQGNDPDAAPHWPQPSSPCSALHQIDGDNDQLVCGTLPCRSPLSAVNAEPLPYPRAALR
ncbi:hypothetical protein [Amycolatopsis sp. GM8]|uniref:hypothetical protein n=1 Tax=Amycolatopsis sp. GM8 TaxID=2896530 RepID=UPI001F2598BC|nr:hypothetical protein [Amycolatopsis sp. GM8]